MRALDGRVFTGAMFAGGARSRHRRFDAEFGFGPISRDRR
jgi:hypothetical protein